MRLCCRKELHTANGNATQPAVMQQNTLFPLNWVQLLRLSRKLIRELLTIGRFYCQIKLRATYEHATQHTATQHDTNLPSLKLY